MTNNMKRHLLTLYTRTPLHVGSGTSVDVVDLPIIRERITGFPVIPSTSLKGVLLQQARETWGDPRKAEIPPDAKVLFGAADTVQEGGEKKQVSNAGCVQIMEAKILAFPVRSLAGCFAWLTCPAVLERFQRDTGRKFEVPQAVKDHVIVPGDSQLTVPGQLQVVFEEYALATQPADSAKAKTVADSLKGVCADPLWSESLFKRLAIVHDENFQHFVTTCTEVVARIAINPETRTVKGSAGEGGGALFNQENVPCEALFYSVLTVLPPRRNGVEESFDPNAKLAELLPDGKDPKKHPPILQIGGDETTGHGLCETKREELP
jgi:CRISPR-associated protein Cmr4